MGTPSEVALRYDADGLLVRAGLPTAIDSSPTMTLTRNSSTTGVANNGLLTAVTVGSIVDERNYNNFGELASYAARYSGNTLYSAVYEDVTGATFARDVLGRIVRKVETIVDTTGTTTTTKTTRYEYDLAGRLWKVQNAAGLTAIEYVYQDALTPTAPKNGVRAAKKVYATPGDVTPAQTITAEYDAQDRIKSFDSVTYEFRASGELSKRIEGGVAEDFTYDGRGNLLKVVKGSTTIDYIIDPLGRRVGKKVGGVLKNLWIYDGQLKIVGEIDDAGVVTQYVYATRPNVPEYAVRGGIAYRIITDHLGSVRFVLRASDAAVMQRMDYDEFGVIDAANDYIGEVSPGVPWKPVPFGFAGGLYDRHTRLVRFGARDYDAETGSWTAKDPVRFEARDSNLYRYVQSDPINLRDPAGLWPWTSPCDFIVFAGFHVGSGIACRGNHACEIGGFVLGEGVAHEVCDPGPYPPPPPPDPEGAFCAPPPEPDSRSVLWRQITGSWRSHV